MSRAIFIAAAIVAASAGGSLAKNEQAVVEIDVAGRIEAHSMVGFLHAMSATNPPEAMIAPLRPAFWRAGKQTPQIFDRATNLGARVTIVLSDLWGYPRDGVAPPYSDLMRWDEFVKKTAAGFKGKPVIFDVWNEPNGDFWPGSFEQYLDLFRRTEHIIRAECGSSAMLCGPGFNAYTPNLLDKFFDYCVAQNVRVEILSLHEFREDSELQQFDADLKKVRKDFLQDSSYTAVGLREIHVQECLPARSQFRPGSILGCLAVMERNNISAAARACWDEPTGCNNCFNDTLDGLLTPDTFQPRAAWWAYRLYADSVPTRIAARCENPTLAIFASAREKFASVLVGYFALKPDSRPLDVKIRVSGLGDWKFTKRESPVAGIYRIPNSGVAEIPAPETVKTVPLASGDNSFVLPGVAPYEAWLLCIGEKPGWAARR